MKTANNTVHGHGKNSFKAAICGYKLIRSLWRTIWPCEGLEILHNLQSRYKGGSKICAIRMSVTYLLQQKKHNHPDHPTTKATVKLGASVKFMCIP